MTRGTGSQGSSLTIFPCISRVLRHLCWNRTSARGIKPHARTHSTYIYLAAYSYYFDKHRISAMAISLSIRFLFISPLTKRFARSTDENINLGKSRYTYIYLFPWKIFNFNNQDYSFHWLNRLYKQIYNRLNSTYTHTWIRAPRRSNKYYQLVDA